MRRTSKIKRILSVVLLALSALLPLCALEAEGRPTSIALEWDAVDGAVWYDIYIDGIFRSRLPADTFSAEVDCLRSHTEYTVAFAARDAENKDLSAEFAHVTTTGWDGFYKWTAPEGHDTNKGKLTEILYEVITRVHPTYGQYYEVWSHIPEGRFKLYPIMEFDELKPGWTGFLDDSVPARTYKITSEKFNKSSVLPKKWKINTFGIDYDMEYMTVETVATLGIRVETTQYFVWDIDEDGERTMTFYVDAPGFIKAFLTLCEEDYAEDGEFILREVKG